jgi:hypothetical protein
MLRLRPLLRVGLLLLLIVSTLVPRIARADGADAPIHLVVRGDDLPREKLRDAIAKELGRPVILDDGAAVSTNVVTITYRESEAELAVTWDGAKRGTVSRVVPARPKRADVIVDAALLAGNLVRDEADELVKKTEPPPLPPPELTPLPSPTMATSSPVASDRAPTPKDPNFLPFNFSLFYPLASNFGRPQMRTRFDFNILHARIGQLDGVQVGGLNVVERRKGESTGDMTGLQLGWLANVTTGTTTGMQTAFLGNIASNAMTGWQVGSIGNYAGGDTTGLQSAMLLNVSSGTVRGVQLAAINVAGDVKGMQLGLINVARKVQGGMFGAVNVADDVDGVPFGVASVTKTGGVHPTTWFSSTTFGNVGVRLATKYTYTMPMAHFHHAYGHDFFGAGFVIGGRIPIDDARYVDTDLGFSWLGATTRTRLPNDPDTYYEHLVQPKLRAMIGWRFANHFGVFAGAGLLTQLRLERDMELVTIRVGPDFFAGIEL